MDYDKLIQRQVKKAFALVGNLATTVTFIKDKATSFDFAAGDVVIPPADTLTIKGIPVKLPRPSKDIKSADIDMKRFQFLMSDVVDATVLQQYNSATFNGATWKIIAPFLSDKYLCTVTFVRSING